MGGCETLQQNLSPRPPILSAVKGTRVPTFPWTSVVASLSPVPHPLPGSFFMMSKSFILFSFSLSEKELNTQ